jgi:hypothetical protein
MKFKIGDKVRCIPFPYRQGLGWKECLEFTIDHYIPADHFTPPVYFPREGHGVNEEALELVEENVKELPKSFACKNTDEVLWKKYIAWLNKTYGKSFEGISRIWKYYGIDKNGLLDYDNKGVFGVILSLEEWDEIVNGVKQETKTETKVMNKTIKKSDLKKIYDVACLTWQKKIETEYATRNPWGDTIEFTQSEIDEMFKAADSPQTKILEEVFGKQQKGLDFRSADINLKVDGLPVFGGKKVPSREAFIGLPYGADKRDSFYLNPNYNWTLKNNKLTVTRK